jgi:hypothetical protein
MFSLFKKSPPTIPYTDKVWKKAEYASKGMLMMAMMRLQQGKPCLLVNFFESETEKLTVVMGQHQLGFVRLDDSVTTTTHADSTLYLATASELSKTSVSGFLKFNAQKFSGEVLFSGHYPIGAIENEALQNLTSLGYDRFVFCLSFDDPLLKVFGSQNILPLLEKLGLAEEEAIEHAMVTQAIKRARTKIEEKVVREIKAKSPEEWFALNVKK